MKKFLLVTTILSVGLNPLAFSLIPKAYAESASGQSAQTMSMQEKKALLEKKLAAVTKRVEDSLAKIEAPEEKAKAEEAFNAARKIPNPVQRGKALAQLGKVLSVPNDQTRSKLLSQYASHAERTAAAAPDAHPSASSAENTADTASDTPASGTISNTTNDDSPASVNDSAGNISSGTASSTGTTGSTGTTTATTTTTSTNTTTAADIKEKKDLVYQTLEAQYVESNCKVMTSSQKSDVQDIYDYSDTANFSSNEEILNDFETKMTNFFENDYVPNNCTEEENNNNNNNNNNNASNNGSGGGGGGNTQMCQLAQMLQTLIPAAAKALTSGGTLGDANAIGQQELEALKKNKDKIDKTEDQKKEREKQLAMVMQGLAAISKMLGGGKNSGQGGGNSCGGNNQQQQQPGTTTTTTTTTTIRN